MYVKSIIYQKSRLAEEETLSVALKRWLGHSRAICVQVLFFRIHRQVRTKGKVQFQCLQSH